MINKDRAKELLGYGASVEDVAKTLGCDHSYISQLLADEQFSAEVSNLRADKLASASARDNKINAIEDVLIERLKEAIDARMIFKAGDLLRAFAVVNKAERRGFDAPLTNAANQTIVNLTMPTKIINKYVTNVNNEVIEINDATLVTMPTAELLRSLQKGDNKDVYKKVAGFLPTAQLGPQNNAEQLGSKDIKD